MTQPGTIQCCRKNRDRLLKGDIAAKFLAAVLAHPKVKKILSSDHLSVGGTLIEARLRAHDRHLIATFRSAHCHC